MPEWPRRRGLCPVCGWVRPITKADRLRKHRRERTYSNGTVMDPGHFRVHCNGSGSVPTEIRIYELDGTTRRYPPTERAVERTSIAPDSPMDEFEAADELSRRWE